MKMQSDFFEPYNDLMTEANIFCNHNTAKDWFYYFSNRTITDVLVHVDDRIMELEWIEEHLSVYTYELLTALEGYERYEMCKRVNEQRYKFRQELQTMWVSLNKLDK